MTNLMKRFAQDDSGLTAIEYGLIGGLIAAAAVVFTPILTTALNGVFTRIGASLDTAG